MSKMACGPVQQANGILQLNTTRKNWQTIIMNLLAAPPNQHSFNQYVMEQAHIQTSFSHYSQTTSSSTPMREKSMLNPTLTWQ